MQRQEQSSEHPDAFLPVSFWFYIDGADIFDTSITTANEANGEEATDVHLWYPNLCYELREKSSKSAFGVVFCWE